MPLADYLLFVAWAIGLLLTPIALRAAWRLARRAWRRVARVFDTDGTGGLIDH
jgi:hypothetical protein